jgi:hypothetical protein
MSLADKLNDPKAQGLMREIKGLQMSKLRIQTEKLNPDYSITVDLKDGGPFLEFKPDPTRQEIALNSLFVEFLDRLSNYIDSRIAIKERELKKLIA